MKARQFGHFVVVLMLGACGDPVEQALSRCGETIVCASDEVCQIGRGCQGYGAPTCTAAPRECVDVDSKCDCMDDLNAEELEDADRYADADLLRGRCRERPEYPNSLVVVDIECP